MKNTGGINMEGITEIDKTKYIDECKEIVRNEILEELSDEMLTIVQMKLWIRVFL